MTLRILESSFSPMAIDDTPSFFFSPWPDRLEAFGDHPARRGAGAGGGGRARRIVRGAGGRDFRLYRRGGAGALAPARHGGFARRRPRHQSGGICGGRRRRCRHAGSRRAARPRRPRHSPQCGRGPACAGIAQERACPVRAALTRDHHRASRSHRNHRTPPRHLSRSRSGRSLDGACHHTGAGADACSAAQTNAC